MSKKIEVGEYVRTENGFIGKLIESENGYLNYKFKRITVCKTSLERGDIVGKTVKHSKNIIDLIEEGDYVNGNLVKHIYKDYDKIEVISETVNDFVYITDIRFIVTKERFKSVEYEVE